MTISRYPDQASSVARRELTEDKMEQIRDLLYGEFKRDSDARLALLEAHVRELETGLHRKLDALGARLEQMQAEIRSGRNSDLDGISQGLSELGERIRRLSRG